MSRSARRLDAADRGAAGLGRGSKFIANAESFLTRWWAAASWSARDDLLKTADWLLRVETRGDNKLLQA